jgi:hypothetical protein
MVIDEIYSKQIATVDGDGERLRIFGRMGISRARAETRAA